MKTTPNGKEAKTKTITVKVDEQNPIDVTILAEHIIAVSDAFQKISDSKLTQSAIVLLIHDLSKVNKGDIELVLHNAKLLKKYFTK